MTKLWHRLTKREPDRADRDWHERTYPCCRWFCFRRSPAWRAFSREGKSYCDRHIPLSLIDGDSP